METHLDEWKRVARKINVATLLDQYFYHVLSNFSEKQRSERFESCEDIAPALTQYLYRTSDKKS